VVEVRDAQSSYNNNSGVGDSNSVFLLGGADVTLTRRFTGSLRLGETFAQYQTPNTPTQASPYVESTFNYGYGRASTLSWTARYGFENSAGNQSNVQKTLRTGLSLSQVFTPKLSASVSLGYAHDDYSPLQSSASQSTSDDTVSIGLGTQFVLSRSLSFFGSLTRSQVFNANAWQSYSQDIVSLGGTFHF
jgi:hypothetical protein